MDHTNDNVLKVGSLFQKENSGPLSLRFETLTRAECEDKWSSGVRIGDGSCWLNIAHSTAILRLCSLHHCTSVFAILLSTMSRYKVPLRVTSPSFPGVLSGLVKKAGERWRGYQLSSHKTTTALTSGLIIPLLLSSLTTKFFLGTTASSTEAPIPNSFLGNA